MNAAQAELTQRAKYLETEIKVWSDRRNRATVSQNKQLIALYINDEMDYEMGRMMGELHRIRLELGADEVKVSGRRPGRRRAKEAA